MHGTDAHLNIYEKISYHVFMIQCHSRLSLKLCFILFHCGKKNSSSIKIQVHEDVYNRVVSINRNYHLVAVVFLILKMYR